MTARRPLARPALIPALIAATIALVLGVLTLGLGAAGAVGVAATRPMTPQPDPQTIVKVTGDAANGFGIHHYDGSALFPPTGSEARAECSAYDKRVARVRCRTEVRVQYAGYAELKRSLAYARSR